MMTRSLSWQAGSMPPRSSILHRWQASAMLSDRCQGGTCTTGFGRHSMTVSPIPRFVPGRLSAVAGGGWRRGWPSRCSRLATRRQRCGASVRLTRVTGSRKTTNTTPTGASCAAGDGGRGGCWRSMRCRHPRPHIEQPSRADHSRHRSRQSTQLTLTVKRSPVCGSVKCTAQAMQGSNEWMVRRISTGCLTSASWWLSCSAAS